MALRKIPIPPKAPAGLEQSWTFLNRLFTNFQRRLPRYRFMGGAQMELSSNQSIANNVIAGTAVDWDNTIYDDADLWDGGNPSRLTVPTGFDGRAYVAANVRFDSNDTGTRYVRILKNGALHKGMPFQMSDAPNNVMGINVAGCMVDVDEGDYFEVEVFQDSGAGLNVLAQPSTWFHMILYEKSAK